MTEVWVIRIRRPNIYTVVGFTIGGCAIIGTWLFLQRFFSRKGLSKSSNKISNIHFENIRKAPISTNSERSMSLLSRRSLLFPRNVPVHNEIHEIIQSKHSDNFEILELKSPMDCGRLGLFTLDVVIEQLEASLTRITEAKLNFQQESLSSNCAGFISELKTFLENSYLLRERYKRVFILQAPDSDIQLLDSVSDTDTASFASAVEQIDFSELEILLMSNFHRPLYRTAMKELGENNVSYRYIRTEFVQCQSDIEYLSKLTCIRQAFNLIFSSVKQIEWITEMGSCLTKGILAILGYPTEEFEDAFRSLITYLETLKSEELVDQLKDELYNKGVCALNFYDIVLDMALLDALQNLSNPPSSILVLTRNNWLSNNFKISALNSAVWTILTAKRKLLQYSDGFFAHYYRVIETFAPALAWGFLGPDETVNNFCENLRKEVVKFVCNLFLFADTNSKNSSSNSLESFKTITSLETENFKKGEELDEEEDDSTTITAEDFLIPPNNPITLKYYGQSFDTVENLAKGIYISLDVFQKRLSRLILEFTTHDNIDIDEALLNISIQPPFLLNSFSYNT